MKKTILSLFVVAGFVSAAQAAACPEANYDGCVSDGYSIVEAEPNVYWPHKQMESAHFKTKRKVHYRRVRVRRSLFSCAR